MGRRFEVDCERIGHGGFVVGRSPEDRVVFVRHALPGERVLVEVTEGTEEDRFWRGDAVEVLSAAPGRVAAPCAYAGPGGCGGCDFQHVDPAVQRELKATVVAEQLSRLAGLEWPVTVQAVGEGAGWRTRMAYVQTPAGPGLRRHRSHDVVPIERCMIAAEEAQPGMPQDAALRTVTAAGRTLEFAVDPDGFWQPHRQAPTVLVEAVLRLAQVRPGERVLDLYAGVGLFSAFLADAGAEVTPVEGHGGAARLAADNAGVESVHADVAAWLGSADAPSTADVVVLDPPRVGAKRRVVEGVTALAPRAIVHVACDPAALGRDVALYAEQGYRLVELEAYDLFPMTHHVEVVATLERADPDQRC